MARPQQGLTPDDLLGSATCAFDEGVNRASAKRFRSGDVSIIVVFPAADAGQAAALTADAVRSVGSNAQHVSLNFVRPAHH